MLSLSGTSYSFEYDVAGRQSSVLQTTHSFGVNRGFQSTWTYDELDRVVQHGFPDDEAFLYTYDGTRLASITGNPSNAVYPGKVLKSAQYDALGRIQSLQIGERNGSAVASLAYGYDSATARLNHVTGSPGRFTPGDADGDGVSNDRCPNVYALDNQDVGGVGTSSGPDNIGNACQCGDVNGDGRVTSADKTAMMGLFYNGIPLAKPELCDVVGNGECNLDDYLAVSSALSSPPGDLQHCLPATPANVPSSEPLDLAVDFDGLGRLTSQMGSLGSELVSRSYTYDGLSRLKTAIGPWEKPSGITASVTWTYSYDALGDLRTVRNSPSQSPPARSWSYTDPVRPRFLTGFAPAYQPDETISANAFGETSTVTRYGGQPESLSWNAQGKLYRYKSSSYAWDAFDQNTAILTGPSGSPTTIVRVGDDFEYQKDGRATKYFSVGGVRIAALATSYTAFNASVPAPARYFLRRVEPLGAPLAAGFVLVSLASLAAIATRKRPPVWVSAPGVSALSLVLVTLPSQAWAATSPSGGPGSFGRPAERFLAYLSDHLGTIRAVVNENGMVLETRDYDPFGADLSHVGVFATQHRFTGQPADEQAGGLYNYGARFYSARWGRFVSPDEVTQGFDSQGLSPYVYVLNRPTSQVDPSGHDSFAIAPAIPILGGVWVTGEVRVPTGRESSVTFRSYAYNLPWADYGSLAIVDSLNGIEFDLDTLQISLDGLSLAMDLSGLGAPFSWVPDAANGAISASRGDYEGAVLSAVASVPAAGASANVAHGARVAEKATSKIDRAAFRSARESFWRTEAKANPGKYTRENLERMEKGKAPIGVDGHPMELHHTDGTMAGEVTPMTRTDHRLGENFRLNHPWLGGGG